MFNNKKDVLLESVKKVMQESELHRKLEAELNEAYGIVSRAALPHEYVAEYDAILAEAKKTGSLPRNEKEAQLAALTPPRTHVTHKDVLRGRGVIEEDEQEIKNKRMKLRTQMADPWAKRPSNLKAKEELKKMFGTKELLNKLAYPKKLEEANEGEPDHEKMIKYHNDMSDKHGEVGNNSDHFEASREHRRAVAFHQIASKSKDSNDIKAAARATARANAATKNAGGSLAKMKLLDEASLEARQKVLARSKMRSQKERGKLGPDASSLMGTKEGEAYTQASAREAGAERGVMRRMKPSFGKNVVKEEKATEAQKAKVAKVMHKWKQGKEHIGKSEKTVPVTKEGQKQAVAIALSQAGLSKKKRMDESLESIHEEIRNSLWEKLDYVYENYGEDAAMEMYASLTEEEQQILEFINDPNSQWNRLTKPALNKAWNWAKDNASSIASTVTKAIPGANAIEPGIQAAKAIGNAASSARAGLQNAARNGPQVTAARQQNYRAAHNTPEPTTGTGEPNRSPAPARTAASPPGAGTEHTPAAAPRSAGMLDADRQAQQKAWGVKAGSPRNDGVEADQTLGGPSKPAAPAPAAAPAAAAAAAAPKPTPRPAPSSSGGSSGGQPSWAQKAFNPDTGA